MEFVDDIVCPDNTQRRRGVLLIFLSLTFWLISIVASAIFPDQIGWQILFTGVPSFIGVSVGVILILLNCCPEED
jgi:hypothetical protein